MSTEQIQPFIQLPLYAQCFAPFLKLPDIRALVATSKACYKTFTDKHLWLSICNQNNLTFDFTPTPNPYTQLSVCPPKLKVAAHWRFDQYLWESHNPTIFLDRSGNKNHLGKIPHPYPCGGYPPNHGIFAHLADDQALKAKQKFTAEVILCPGDMIPGNEYQFPILSKHGHAAGWEIRCNNKLVSFLLTPFPPSHAEIIHHRNNQPGAWLHIAGTFDGREMCLYVDGKLVKSTKFRQKVTTLADLQAPFSVGFCHPWRDRSRFTGEIKEARICYKTLKPEQFLRTKIAKT